MPPISVIEIKARVGKFLDAASAGVRPNIEESTEQLRECFSLLTGMTSFKSTPEGASFPLIRQEFCHARDFIEAALDHLNRGDLHAALEEAQQALHQLERVK